MPLSESPAAVHVALLLIPFDQALQNVTSDDLRLLPAAAGKTAEPLLQASTVDRLRDILRRSAELLRETGTQVLSGDENAFNAVARLQRQDADRVTREQLSKQARRGLEKAWSTGDFASVVEILEEMPALGPLDKERLQYARKHSDRHKM